MFKEYRNKAFDVEICAPVFLVSGAVLVFQALKQYFQRDAWRGQRTEAASNSYMQISLTIHNFATNIAGGAT